MKVKKVKFKERVFAKLFEISKYVRELEEILPSEDEYIHNLTIRRACEKTIELAIETVIDIISMVVREEKYDFPDDEENLITIVTEKKVISPKLSLKLKEMKRFRNILIHKYGNIDNEQAYEFMENETKDFLEFEKEIKKYLQKKK